MAYRNNFKTYTHMNTLKTPDVGRRYESPSLNEVELCAEGIFCSSFEMLYDEFDYTWEE